MLSSSFYKDSEECGCVEWAVWSKKKWILFVCRGEHGHCAWLVNAGWTYNERRAKKEGRKEECHTFHYLIQIVSLGDKNRTHKGGLNSANSMTGRRATMLVYISESKLTKKNGKMQPWSITSMHYEQNIKHDRTQERDEDGRSSETERERRRRS